MNASWSTALIDNGAEPVASTGVRPSESASRASAVSPVACDSTTVPGSAGNGTPACAPTEDGTPTSARSTTSTAGTAAPSLARARTHDASSTAMTIAGDSIRTSATVV